MSKRFVSIMFCSILLCLLTIPLLSQRISKKIDKLVKAYSNGSDFNGNVLVAKGNSIILNRGYGFRNAEQKIKNDADGIYQVASITKQFTSAIIMQLQQEGKLSVQDKLDKYYPGFPDADKITIEHLLTHTSGIYDFEDDEELQKLDVTIPYKKEELLSFFMKHPLKFAPGSKYGYSNIGYSILGYIIEMVTDKPYENVVRERILSPLGMYHSGFDFAGLKNKNKEKGYISLKDNKPIQSIIVDSTISYASGALYATTLDLYKWERAIYSGKILSAESWKSIFKPYKNKYGYGWGIDTIFNKVSQGHGGEVPGFSSYLIRIPEDHVLIILLDNSSSAALPKMAKSIAAILYHQPYETPYATPPVAIDQSILQKYVGVYESSPTLSITIAKEGSQLKAKPTGRGFYEIYPESERVFKLRVIDAKIEFVLDNGGNVTELIFYRGTKQIRGRKVN